MHVPIAPCMHASGVVSFGRGVAPMQGDWISQLVALFGTRTIFVACAACQVVVVGSKKKKSFRLWMSKIWQSSFIVGDRRPRAACNRWM